MPFVVDNSVVVGWYFTAQKTPYTEAVFNRLAQEMAYVPALWPLEFSNVVRKALLSKRISEQRAKAIMDRQASLQLTVDDAIPIPVENMNLALRHGLTSYDAAYLDLALRHRIPIATLDAALRKAAEAAGIGVVA